MASSTMSCHKTTNNYNWKASQNAKPIRIRFAVKLSLTKTTVKKKKGHFIHLCSPQSHNECLLKI